MNLTPSDRAALEIGRLFMRAHAAEHEAASLAARLAELDDDEKSSSPPEQHSS